MRKIPLAELLKAGIDSLFLFVMIDTKGLIRHLSKAYAAILGIPAEEAIGQPVKKIIPTTGLLRVLETGKSELGQLFVLKNGESTICNRMVVYDEDEKIIGVMSMALFPNMDQLAQFTLQLEKLQKENELYQRQLDALKQNRFCMDSIVGNSPQIKKIKETLKKAAMSKLCVLLTGETGTGKEVFANAIHQMSPRCYGNFVKVNCAAIPNELLESELFGYEGGAFSGAVKGGKPGKFELANNGTIMLDEINELPLHLQSKLLRVLQENELERLGSTKSVSLDIRVICCTNQNLGALIEANRFRNDLYYRINTVEIAIPPLRDRREDISLLCDSFVKKINFMHGCYIEGVSESMVQHFLQYNWPGNVRELEHVLEQACVMTASGILNESHFDFFLPRVYPGAAPLSPLSKFDVAVEAVEKDAILKALQNTKGNKLQAAALLNISRSRLYERLRKYNIEAVFRSDK
ncbi:MAG: sigma 54-interacting transcriptional regulator [Spirochaetaceae bacterium]|jgi:transcriptional regulator with PAS, ATPase and Fis domain|nr:sigma 54-interacting transcriptional regulator [Spirochaetaceae bacterium]